MTKRRVRHRRVRRGASPSQRLWIGRAIREPGALRRYVQREWGSQGFTKRGTIRVSILRSLAEGRGREGKRVTLKTRRRARLALTLRELREGGGER